jgi:O-acetyl-ADP-ribose deacetylase
MIELVKGDITILDVDAIVNAANSSLMGGGGVDGAIHRAGGPQILEECKVIRNAQGGCKPGEAVITSGGKLKAKFVIHTVGPIWQGGKQNEEDTLRKSYLNSLRLAVENTVTSIAFPNISTGVYGFPKVKAAEIAIAATRDFLKGDKSISRIIFCCFDQENFDIYSTRLK